jgi:succinoglycan biosynthesis protein ExoM
MPQTDDIRVAICICTFKRPRLLRELLCELARLAFRKVREPQIKVILVDNDELASAEEIWQTVSIPWALKYVVEPTRGISYARNRAVAETGTVDFIAFIDDDETPSPDWLDELLWAQAKFAADIVSGPVFPKYARGVDVWVKSGRFFEARTFATGTQRNTCACNNVLVAAEVFRHVQKFNHAFALSGAEDADFFLRANEAGYKIVWSQEAAVFEVVSPPRGTAAWLLRREFQTGNGWVFCEAVLQGGVSNWLLRLCKAGGHVAIGSASAISRLLMIDKIGVVHSLQRISLGAGMLAALAGYRFLAYKDADVHVGRVSDQPNRVGTTVEIQSPGT